MCEGDERFSTHVVWCVKRFGTHAVWCVCVCVKVMNAASYAVVDLAQTLAVLASIRQEQVIIYYLIINYIVDKLFC